MADTGHWMPFYWADYFSNTNHFTTEEHGAYVLLIGTYWRRGCALPADPKFLAACARLPIRRSKLVMEKLSEKFVFADGLWYHVRVEIELLRSSERLASARANGRAGGIASGQAKSNTTTTTPTKEIDLSNFRVGSQAGIKNGHTIQDPGERLNRFKKTLAEAIGRDGFQIVGQASDPQNPLYRRSLEICRQKTKDMGKGWPPQWRT